MERRLQGEPNPGQAGEQRNYMCYLLRLWCARGDDEATCGGYGDSFHGTGRQGWRASLESPHTGERLGFGSLEDLFGFLRARAGLAPGVDGNQSGEPVRFEA